MLFFFHLNLDAFLTLDLCSVRSVPLVTFGLWHCVALCLCGCVCGCVYLGENESPTICVTWHLGSINNALIIN